MLQACVSSIKSFAPVAKFFSSGRPYQSYLSIYLVCHREHSDEAAFIHKVLQAVRGGVTCVQLREDHVEIGTVLALKEKLRPFGVPLIINNHAKVAHVAKTTGIHLGQRDLPYLEARRLLGPRAIIGLTVESWEDVKRAEEWDVDYLGVQVFPSKHTKPESLSIWGLDGLRKVRSVSRHRLVAIGGMTLQNLPEVYQTLHMHKGDGVAMVGALWRTENSYVAAKKVQQFFQTMSRGADALS